jgi:hypothetical protein
VLASLVARDSGSEVGACVHSVDRVDDTVDRVGIRDVYGHDRRVTVLGDERGVPGVEVGLRAGDARFATELCGDT